MLMVMLVSLLPSGALAAEAPTGATNEVASVEEPTEVEPATGETEETLPVESKTDGTENEDNNETSNTEGTSEGAPVSDDNEKDPAEDGTIGTAKSEETVSAPDALKAPEPVVLNKGAADEIVVSVEDAAPGSSLSASIAIPSDYDEQIKLVAGEDYELLLALDIHLDPIGDWVQVKLQSPLLAYAADERGEQPALYHVYEENGVKRAIQIDFEADWIKGEITFRTKDFSPFVLACPSGGQSSKKLEIMTANAPDEPPMRSSSLSDTNYGDLNYGWNIQWNVAEDGTNYTYDEDGTLLLHPHDRSALNASISIEMSVSAPDTETQQTIPAGAVEFHIPAHLFYGWNGNPADVLSTQVATDPAAAANNKVSFIYRIDGDEIIVSNYEPLEGGTFFAADFAYIANPLDVNGGYPDDTKEHENWWDNYLNCYEKAFTARFFISDGSDTEQGEKSFSLRLMTRPITATYVAVMPDANKGVYLAWQSNWGDKPENADQFFYVLWNVQYGRDASNQSTQGVKGICDFRPEENRLSFNGQTFTPQLVGVKKSGNVHGIMGFLPTSFSYYGWLGAPSDIAGKDAQETRLIGSSYHPDYSFYKSGYNGGLATHYAVLLRYPWEAFEAAREDGIDLANDGLPVTGTFHVIETWDSGYQRDYPGSATTPVFLRDGQGQAVYKKQGGCNVYGGQTLISNGDYLDCGTAHTFSISYDGHSERNGSTLLGQHIEFSDDTMWAFSDKARNPWGWNPSDKEYLETGDFTYRAFWIGFSERSGQYVNGYWVEDDTNSTDYEQFAPLYIYIKGVSDTDYQPYCAVTYSDSGAKQVNRWNGTDILEQLPASAPSSGFALPENTVGIKLSHDSAFYRSAFSLQLGVRLHPTSHLQDIVARHMSNNALTYIRNDSLCTVTTLDGTPVHSFTSENGGYDRNHNRIILTPLDAALSVSKTSITPDDTDSRQKAAAAQDKEISYVMLTAQMLVDMNPEDALHTNAEDSYKMLEGTFYELLPKGTRVQTGTISGIYDRYRVMSPVTLESWIAWGYRFRSSGNYSYEIPADCVDYSTYTDEATGQTMLVIHYKFEDPECVQYDGKWFNRVHFAFVMENTFDNVQDRGTQTPNALAFSIPQKPTPLSVLPANQFEAVDMGSRGGAFEGLRNSGDYAAYTQVNINWNAVRVLEAGFKKSISNQETKNGLPADNSYTAETHVTVGNGYSYRLKFSNNPKTKADHIVFYDILEQGTADRPDSAWRGVFQGVDLSSICETPTDGGTAVCAPVVYYSTKTDFGPVAPNNDFGDLQDASVWTTLMPEDKGSITAIAIDCSKASDGSNFILGREKTLVAYVLMASPNEYVPGKAINGAVARARLFENEPPEGEPDAQNHNGVASYASGILDPIVLSLHKQSDPETGTAEDPRIVPGDGSGTIDYTVTVENSGTYDVRNVTVADVIPAHLTITGIQASLNGAAAKDIGEIPGINLDRDGNSLSFVIAQQHPGSDRKTVFYISTSVDKLTEPAEHFFENTAAITSANGLPQNIKSETTYHLAAVVSADVDIPVEKVWEGTDKQKAELMPDAITIKLKADGNVIDTVDLSEDNQWKHTFTGLPEYKVVGEVGHKIKYTIEEVKVEGYTAGVTTGSVTDGFTVTNTPYEPVEVTLEVTKELKGRDWETDDSFEFVLANTDDDPMPEAGGETVTVTKNEPTGKFGTIEFLKKGNYHYTIKETKEDLDGVRYDATEKPVEVIVTEDDATGKLKAECKYSNASSLTVTNVFTPITQQLEVTKVLEGREWTKDDSFKFTLTAKTEGAPVPEDNTVTVTKDSPTGKFSPMTFKKAGDYEYTIKEVDEGLGGVTYDVTEHTVIVHVSKDEDNQFSATVEYETDKGLIITNVYDAEGTATFEAFKQLNGRKLKEGEFNFILKDSEGEVIETVPNDAEGKAVFTAIGYKLSEDKDKLPIQYTIEEEIPEEKLGGVSYSESVMKINVFFTDKGDGTLNVVTVYSELDNQTFVNDYASAGELPITAKKELTGRKLAAGQFSAELVDEEGKVLQTVQNDENGVFTFEPLTYTQDEFKTEEGYAESVERNYTVREVDEGKPGYIYDKTEFPIHVVLTDDQAGKISVDTSAQEMEFVFRNEYKAKGDIQIKAQKLYNGGKLEDGMFTFCLYDQDGKLIEKVKNDATGDVTFAAIAVDETVFANGETDAVKTYTVKEEKPLFPKKGVTYDSRTFTATVALHDEGDGTISSKITWSVDGKETEKAAFVNNYEESHKSSKSGRSSKTGDSANGALWALLLLMAGGALGGTVWFKRRKKI